MTEFKARVCEHREVAAMEIGGSNEVQLVICFDGDTDYGLTDGDYIVVIEGNTYPVLKSTAMGGNPSLLFQPE